MNWEVKKKRFVSIAEKLILFCPLSKRYQLTVYGSKTFMLL